MSVLRDKSGVIIFGVCMIACLLYCLICIRCRRRRRSRVDRPPQTGFAMSANGAASTHDEEPRDAAGLTQPAIDALPTFAYHVESKDSCAATAHCAVCLSPVAEGEMVRLLPDCRHAFHAECIDKWLHSHSQCPLCRAEAKPPVTLAEKGEVCRESGQLPPPPV